MRDQPTAAKAAKAARAAKVEWLNIHEASEALGVGATSVRNKANAGAIRTKDAIDPETNLHVKLYHAGDVERVRHERANPKPRANGQEVAVVAPPSKLAPLPAPLHAAPGSVVALEMPLAMPLALWLTVRQAAEYLGFPEADLVEWIREGKLQAYDRGKHRRHGRWRIARKTLDEFSV
jgi:excisionase family DNA binding protein